MCIRDRYNTGRKVPLSQAKRGDLIFWGPGGNQHVALYLGNGQMLEASVSYTHLRAHETVLDLVCRLLLEKKKNKKTDIICKNIQRNIKSKRIKYISLIHKHDIRRQRYRAHKYQHVQLTRNDHIIRHRGTH